MAGARWRHTTRAGEAPIARAATANSCSASRATMARTPRATIGHPSRASTPVISVKTIDGGIVDGSAARAASTT